MPALRSFFAGALVLATAVPAVAQRESAPPTDQVEQPAVDGAESETSGDSTEASADAQPEPAAPIQPAPETPPSETQPSETQPSETQPTQTQPTEAQPDSGAIRVVANIRGARVFVDGERVGAVPYEGQLSPGAHRVRVEGDGMKPWEESVTVEPGRLTPIRVRLQQEVGRGGAWASTIFAALFLGGGITLAVLGDDFAGQLREEADAGTLANDDPRLDQGFFMYIGADAAFGLSLILGGLALYYFLYDPVGPSEGSVQEPRALSFAPMLDLQRGAAGLGLTGRF